MLNHIPLRIKYPKFLLLVLTFLLAYLMVRERDFLHLTDILGPTGYLGIFIAGGFFTYGFTTAPAIAALLMLAKGKDVLLAGLLGGIGAMIGDVIIFEFLRSSFSDEIRMLSREKWVRRFHGRIHGTLKKYLIPVLAGFIIASPLPDEIGVVLLAAASKHVTTKKFLLISYVFNTIGIMAILYAGSLL